MPEGAVLERVAWVSPEKVTLSSKSKRTGHVEEHSRWNSRCKGPESESRPSMIKDSKEACVMGAG